MTALLALTSGLMAWLFIGQVRKNRRLKKTIRALSARLARQNELLARLAKAEEAPAADEARRPAPVRRRLIPAGAWPTIAALLILSLATGFLIWFGLTLGRFSPGLRLGVILLAGLTSLTLGLLTWDKRPNLGLALEGWGLGLMGLSLAGAAWFPGLLSPGQARAALSVLGLFSALLALKQNSPCLTVLVPAAFLGLWSIPDQDWSGPPLIAAGFFYLALSLATGRSTLPARRLTPVLALVLWLAGSLASVMGLAEALAEPSYILHWLLAVWSLFSLSLWLAGRLSPDLLISRRPGSPPLLVLAQALPIIPALALGLLWTLADFPGKPGGLDPAAWALWVLAQGLGLTQAWQRAPVAAWSNAFLLTLALALSQAVAALLQTGPAFGRDMGRLAALLAALALCARPPRLALFQELSLCRVAGQILSCLVLWQGLILALDPADRPGFFGFLPVLNLTNLAQAAAFWLPAAFLRRLTAPDRPPALSLLEGSLFFIWLNVALARTVHHLAGVPYQFGALFGSAVFWLVCGGVWGGTGFFFLARFKSNRYIFK